MKKRICKLTLLLLTLCFMFLSASCGNKNTYENSIVFGDADADDVLCICVDIDFNGANDEEIYDIQQKAISDFMSLLRQYAGLENVVFQIIPSDVSERNIMLSRLRTEIMAGYGPDVFILRCMGGNEFTESLIPYPQQAMENALFLPLDTYMENNTQYTEWDKQEQVILAAGKNREGQQIIPLAYTFPLMTCSKSALDINLPDNLLTWENTLNDPVLKGYYKDFVDCSSLSNITQLDGSVQNSLLFEQYLSYIIGNIVDFENEKLLFTEEELMQRITEILERIEVMSKEESTESSPFREGFFGPSVCSGTSITMLPLYSDDGGITAEVTAFAAINHNTEFPEEAYRVIDVLMCEEAQTKSNLYTSGICYVAANTVPLQSNVFSKEVPFSGSYWLDDFSFGELTDIKKQITAVNFRGDLTSDLNTLLYKCYHAREYNATPEDLVRQTYEIMHRKVRE